MRKVASTGMVVRLRTSDTKREIAMVSESGIFTAEDIGLVRRCRVQAVLVGTSIMKSDNPADKVKELVKAGRE